MNESRKENHSVNTQVQSLEEILLEAAQHSTESFIPSLNKKLKPFYRQANEFFLVGDFVDASDRCFELIERIGHFFKNKAIHIKSIESYFELLMSIIHEPLAASDLKRKIYQRCENDLMNSIHQRDGLENRWMELLRAASGEISEEENFNALLLSNWHLPVFRRELIASLFKQKNYEEARKLIVQPKENRRKKILSEKEEMEWLLKIAQKEYDVVSICRFSEKLFKMTYDMNYFFMLKKYVAQATWKKRVQKLLGYIKRDDRFYEDKVSVQVAILLEEKEDAQLLRLFQLNTYLHLLQQYDALLLQKFPHELLELYRKAVERYAEQNMGLSSYREVLKVLKRMLKLPDGKTTVRLLAAKFKVIYGQRRAMVKELNKLVV
jgi:F0F1-type ATP synthase delta subunit